MQKKGFISTEIETNTTSILFMIKWLVWKILPMLPLGYQIKEMYRLKQWCLWTMCAENTSEDKQ